MTGETLNTQGIYVGKELFREGKSAAGKPWRLYKIKFKPSEQSDKNFSFSIFQRFKGENNSPDWQPLADPDLQELQWYTVTYNAEEKTNATGKTYTAKTAFRIQEGKHATPQAAPLPTSQPNKVASIMVEDVWTEFIANYKANIPTAQQNPTHMLGVYVANYYPDQFKSVIDKCKQEPTEEKVE